MSLWKIERSFLTRLGTSSLVQTDQQRYRPICGASEKKESKNQDNDYDAILLGRTAFGGGLMRVAVKRKRFGVQTLKRSTSAGAAYLCFERLTASTRLLSFNKLSRKPVSNQVNVISGVRLVAKKRMGLAIPSQPSPLPSAGRHPQEIHLHPGPNDGNKDYFFHSNYWEINIPKSQSGILVIGIRRERTLHPEYGSRVGEVRKLANDTASKLRFMNPALTGRPECLEVVLNCEWTMLGGCNDKNFANIGLKRKVLSNIWVPDGPTSSSTGPKHLAVYEMKIHS
ncbi:hypothetical protein L218DRAFT_947864 [Marasmius fiardii PR-910]|nr:hypothetical protein L218DRAFT_947864 [Marasmius fiardii PR-910]